MQINKSFMGLGRTMNATYLTIAALASVMLIAGTVFATTGYAFAYERSHAVSQVNDCGNGEAPLNVWCQNATSQIQGDENEAALSSGQGSTSRGPVEE